MFTPSPKMSSPSAITSPRVDPDAELDPLVLWYFAIALRHPALDLNSAPDGVYNTRELPQEPVSGVLHNPAPVLRDLRFDQFLEMRLQAFVRPLLIRALAQLHRAKQ